MAGEATRIKPGEVRNPYGRPKDTIAPLARAKSKEAFATLVSLLKSDDENIQLKASIAIIERGFGKPIQEISGNGAGTVIYVSNNPHLQQVLSAPLTAADPEISGEIQDREGREAVRKESICS